MAVGLSHLAAECGLAQGTVSNILASRGTYAAETRQRVCEAAQRMGYIPSRIATSLRDQCSDAVGVLMSDLTDAYFAELLDALGRALAEQKWEVMVHLSTLRGGADVLDAYRSFLSWRLRGFLISADALRGVATPPDLLPLIRSTVMITLNSNPWPECLAIYPDRAQLAELAIDHLLSLGHRRIGMLAYTADPMHEKTTSFRKALAARGLDLRNDDVVHVPAAPAPGKTVATEGFDIGRRYASAPSKPTAMVAWTDSIATSFVAGFLSGGGRVPEGLSVVAYNNTRLAAVASLPLTVVGVPMGEFAQATVDLLSRSLEARKQGRDVSPRQVKLVPHLVVRSSTGPVEHNPKR